MQVLGAEIWNDVYCEKVWFYGLRTTHGSGV